MATAKSLTPVEIEKLFNYIEQRKNAKRNKLMLLFTIAAGLRVSEVADLKIQDVRL